MFKSHLFLSPTIVSCDQELNYFILQNEGKLFECSYPKPIHGILGKSSMLVAVADTHKRLRNVAVSLVTITKSKPEFLSDIEATTISILHSWKDKSQVIFCEEARKVHFHGVKISYNRFIVYLSTHVTYQKRIERGSNEMRIWKYFILISWINFCLFVGFLRVWFNYILIIFWFHMHAVHIQCNSKASARFDPR